MVTIPGVIGAKGEVGAPIRVLVVVPFAHPPGGVGREAFDGEVPALALAAAPRADPKQPGGDADSDNVASDDGADPGSEGEHDGSLAEMMATCP